MELTASGLRADLRRRTADLADARAGTPACFDNSSVEVLAITGLDSVKWVRGEADIDAVIGGGR